MSRNFSRGRCFMGEILAAFSGWVSSLFSAQIAPGLSFGGFFVLMLILSGIGLVLKLFWGGDAK